VSRLAAFTASVADATAACTEYLPTFERFWQGQIRRMSRDAIRNFQRVQPLGLAAAAEPPFFLPDKDEVLHLPTERAIIAAAVARHWDAINALLVEMGAESGISFAVRNRLVREVLTDRGQHITSIVETTRREVMVQLQEAYDFGESIPKASRRVAKAMGGVSKYRSTMIASTEMIGAVNGASVRLASVLNGTSLNDDGSVRRDTQGHDPLRIFKTWYATMDHRTRPAHAAANGQTVALSAPFSVGGSSMQYPGDPSGPGDQVIHCRCTVTYTEQAGGLIAGGTNPMGKLKFQVRDMQPLAAVDDDPEGPGRWQAVLVLEGVDTADMRRMAPNSLDWRDLPLTLMAQTVTAPGHDGAEVAGRIDEIERMSSGEIVGRGVYDAGEYGQKIRAMVGDGTLRGISVDLAVEEVEFEEPADYDGPPMDELELMFFGVMVVVKGTILGATICPFQAFDDATIQNVEPVAAAAGKPLTLRITRALHAAVAASAGATAPVPAPAELPAPGAGLPPLEGVTAAGAGLVPAAPPLAWFEMPEPDEPTPLTVTDDGQVYGHAALFGTCHIGLPGCTTPPKSQSGYAYFNLGEVVTAEGTRVACGKITVGTGHADLRASRQQTLEHYDNTGTAVADVVARDGRHGPWVCGALRGDVDASRVRELTAAPVSGDWRPINGHLEMVGLLAVNVPGFPVPRQRALAASVGEGEYETLALVAAGIVTPERVAAHSRAMADLRARALGPGALAQLAARAHG